MKYGIAICILQMGKLSLRENIQLDQYHTSNIRIKPRPVYPQCPDSDLSQNVSVEELLMELITSSLHSLPLPYERQEGLGKHVFKITQWGMTSHGLSEDVTTGHFYPRT